ncbi:methyltransferase family protein [Chloroflexota bacterium]
MDAAWYFRLFYISILNSVVAYLLFLIIKAKRMTGPEIGKPMMTLSMISFVVLVVWLWFVPFSINLAFWIGLGIIALGHVVNSLAYSAMREHPEKKQTVVDWGIYKVTRHPHFHHNVIITLGVIVMGWNTGSMVYMFLWAYFVLDVIFTHFAILREEQGTAEKLGQEYLDYMKRVPRYFLILIK